MTTVHPYIHFNGNAEEAFTFYKFVFNTEFSIFQRYSDVPPGQQQNSADENRILHISLPIGNGTILMGSDIPSAFSAVSGDNFYVSIQTSDEAETRKLYEGLSAEGTILMPLENTFFASWFGMFIDKFGIRWMVNCDPE